MRHHANKLIALLIACPLATAQSTVLTGTTVLTGSTKLGLTVGAPPAIVSNFQTGVDNAFLTNSSTGVAAPTLTMNLPNQFEGGNNCAIAVWHGSSTYTVTTPSGWTAGPTVTGANVKMALFYLLGDVSGTTSVSIAATGTGNGVGNSLGGWVTELQNCSITAVGGNGTLDTAATGSAITMTLSAAPSYGDAVMAYFLDTASQNGPSELATVNPGSGYTSLASSKSFGKIGEYSVTTTSTSVPVVYSGTDTILGVGIVIKQGSLGNGPPATKYIGNEQIEQAWASNTVFNFPCTGNLVVVFNSAGSNTVSSWAGSTGTWANAVTNTTNAVAQFGYGYGTGFTSTLTVTPTMSGTPSPVPGQELKFVCVHNAATSSPLDVTNTGNSNQTTAANLTLPFTITPSNLGEITFQMASIDVHTLTGMVADSNGHTPVFLAAIDSKGEDAASTCAATTPNSSLDEDNGWSFYINTSDTLAQTAIFSGTQTSGSCTTNPTGTGFNGYAAASFK